MESLSMVRVPHLHEMPIYSNLAQKKRKRATLLKNHLEDKQSDRDSE
jgi:hypothetical protein